MRLKQTKNPGTTRTRTVSVLALLSVMLVTGTAVADTTTIDDPPGRVVAAHGTLDTIEGTLQWEHDEWYLITDERASYELHLGPYGHQEEPVFSAGASATVEGFLWEYHIAPVTVESDGVEQTFWTTERMPRWAGSGEGGGRVAWNESSIPQGQRLAADDDNGTVPGPRVGSRTQEEEQSDLERGFQNARTRPRDEGSTPDDAQRGFRFRR